MTVRNALAHDMEAAPASAWRGLVLIFLVVAALFHGRLLLAPLQEAVSATLTLDDRAISWLQGPALTVPVALLAVPLGLMIDRLARVRLLLGFGALGMGGGLLTAFGQDFPTLLGARILAGLAASAANMVALSIICDLVPADRRGRSITLISMAQYAGMASAFGLGGWLLTQSGTTDWRHAALGSCVPLLAALIVPILLREPERVVTVAHATSSLSSLGALWRERGRIAPVLAAIAALEVALGAVLIWAAPALIRGYDLTPALVGSAMATGLIASGVAGAVGGGLIADFAQRRGGAAWARNGLAILLAICAVATLFPLLPSAWAAIPLLIVALVGLAAAGVMAIALYTVVVPVELRGLSMGLLTATGVIAFGAAPVLVSEITTWLGAPSALGTALASLCGLSSLLAIICLFLGRIAPPSITREVTPA